jgi:CubicO group peptidase (beta-lactamase class C family)
MKIKLIVIYFITCYLFITPVRAQTPTPMPEVGQVYVITGKESLSGLANRFYDNLAGWPAIVKATNAKASQDRRFSYIKNPDALEVGQWLWIPPKSELPQWIEGYVPDNPILQPLTPVLVQDMADYTEQMRQTFEIPGAALAIVGNNQVLLAQGFGVRQLGQPDPVTPDTIFPIASTTKAVNSMLMATLVDDDLLQWDMPAAEIWPEFKTGASPFTETITFRHLLNMSSGLPRADLVWSGMNLTAEQLMTSLADLPPWAAPGETFYYNNQAVATAGYMGALAAGGNYGQLRGTYNDLMRQRIFKPIGMTHASLTLSELLANPNHAAPHDYTMAGEIMAVSNDNDSSITPAGGINADVTDLARFLLTEINGGITPNGRRIVTTRNLTETWRPQVDILLDRTRYGMGWITERYRGITIVWHEGDVLGYKALIAFYPDAQVGFVLLSNRLLGKWFAYSVLYHFTETLYGLPDWITELQIQQYQTFKETLAIDYANVTTTITATDVMTYIGNYEGSWRVELRPDKTLWVVRGTGEWRLLRAMDGEKPYYKIYNGYGLDSPIEFINHEDGTVTMEFWLSSGEHGLYRHIQ